MNLKQLAKELNLSISAVSKALRDSHEISPATKKAVLAKAKELNYQVNPFASGLRKQKSKTIAVIIPEVVNDFFGPVINGIESIAQEKGYHVLIYLTHEVEQKEVAIINLLQNGRVDGVMISISAQTSDTTHLEALKEKGIPLVFFDRIVERINAPKVITDDYNSGAVATNHLIENGCQRIAFVSLPNKLTITQKRMNGYLDALKNIHIKKDNSLILFCNGDEHKDKDLIRNLLKRKDRPDGIFASVEKLAIITYEVCEELNLNIPADVKVICFSNLKTAGLLNPSLTTITQPAFEIGREAASILFKLIEKKGHHFLLEKTTINSKLIKRISTEKTSGEK
ncbi:LacI family transcriptional regulator [Ginsengibacter hankyongi]|uniref:LacI family transcriptional regulator n=1 Tax=Ginsengibacter hankyongi TaxID=2607284 RepID=A0A5J5IH41_9BACT|nr:LacI family DNA-binding transcriptional regulator [Ginsengibacter hankyongi]KAA9037766.1 LacI family transcriptional regulator [Ginsengibacter hankyongi]